MEAIVPRPLPNGSGIGTDRFDSPRMTAVPTGSGLDLASLLPSEWVGAAYASGGPEVRQLTFGFVPLTDCAPIVVAHAQGLFAKHGIESSLGKFTSWTALRDALNDGATHAAQMLFGMPVGAAVGRLGSDQKPLVIPWVLNRNGQAITLGAKHRGKFAADPKALRPLAVECRDKGRPMVFGITLPPGTHAMWLRYWLGAGGIHPDKDVALITVPPPQMVANMKTGRMDGCCVGEPWNVRAISEGLGFTALLTEQIWPDHPEKVLAFTEEFAEANPNSVKAVLKALHEASTWCDDPTNHDALAALLAEPEYLNASAELIRARLGRSVEYGDERQAGDQRGLSFQARNANYPQPKHCVWWLSQFRRWDMLVTPPDYLGVAGRVMRPDFYEAAMKELGASHGGADFSSDTLFDDHTFDPSEPEEYAASFPITSIRQ
jgi:nitrate/nitrite transport system substrate-binding protein